MTSVLTAAEALARYAERWPANLAEIQRTADAYRERLNANQDAYWIRRDMEATQPLVAQPQKEVA